MNWKQKAAWLQDRGYGVRIEALDHSGDNDPNWAGSINGSGRSYGQSIEDVIHKLYDYVKQKRLPCTTCLAETQMLDEMKDGKCANCADTIKKGKAVFHLHLYRTKDELTRTANLLI